MSGFDEGAFDTDSFDDGSFDFTATPTPAPIPSGATVMSIDFRKYVRIISGVGGAASVPNRELIGRLFSNNSLLSPDSVYEFASTDDVGSIFGFASHEFYRAKFYFGWVSPNITMAKKISFCRFTPTAIAAIVLGTASSSLVTLQTIVAGALLVKTPTAPAGVALAGLNLSGAGSYGAAAAALQTLLRTSSDPALATATATWDSVNSRFVVTSGTVGAGALAFLPAGSGISDTAGLMGLYASAGAWLTVGSAAQTPSSALAAMIGVSTNFGSFLFMNRSAITISQHLDAAAYNVTQNNMFIMCWPVLAADAVAVNAAAIGLAGVAATLYDPAQTYQYPEMVPMIQEAATDYTRRKGVSNYMFKSFNLAPTVTDDTASAAYDALRINYYGQTQINGQQRSFYQNAVLFGPITAPLDQSVFANEQWLKDNVTVGFFNALLALAEIPTNAEGRGICRGIVQTAVAAALLNGVISVAKQFTTLQQGFITTQTGDPTAWRKVQNLGYWYDVEITSAVDVNQVIKYSATYLLIYAKDDAIHSVNGTHALI